MESKFFKFILKENDVTDPDAPIVEHEIKILQPLLPDAFGQVMNFLVEDKLIDAGKLIIEQYMWTQAGKDEQAAKLRERIMGDGRLLMSCTKALTPIFSMCETDLKKN